MSAVSGYRDWISSMNAWLRQPGNDTQANQDAIRAQARSLGVDAGAIGGADAPSSSPKAGAARTDARSPSASGDIDSIGPVADTRRPDKASHQPAVTTVKEAASPKQSVAGDFDTQAQTTAKTPEETKAFADKLITHLQGELGINRNQAIGIVANLMHESAGLNPGMNQGMRIGEPSSNMADDNANGYGLAQWGGVRKQGLIDLAAKPGIPPSSEKANIDFLVQELKGEYSGVIDELKKTDSVEEATASFCNTYEKPSDPQMQSRIECAHQLA